MITVEHIEDNLIWTADGDVRLELWSKSYSGDSKISESSTEVLTYSLPTEGVYRLYVKSYIDDVFQEQSDILSHLHIVGLGENLRELLMKSLSKESYMIEYGELKRLLIKIQSEFAKSNFLSSEEHIKTFKSKYKLIK